MGGGVGSGAGAPVCGVEIGAAGGKEVVGGAVGVPGVDAEVGVGLLPAGPVEHETRIAARIGRAIRPIRERLWWFIPGYCNR